MVQIYPIPQKHDDLEYNLMKSVICGMLCCMYNSNIN